MQEREILKLTRKANGEFCIYADGELMETYEAKPDTYHAMLPIKLWRAFNKVLEKRIKSIGSPQVGE